MLSSAKPCFKTHRNAYEKLVISSLSLADYSGKLRIDKTRSMLLNLRKFKMGAREFWELRVHPS